MKEHQLLTITGTKPTLLHVLANVDQRATGEWTRDLDREEGVAKMSVSSSREDASHCYVCNATAKHRAADVWFGLRGEDRLWIWNIVPREIGHMHKDECNAVVMDFYNQLIIPSTKGLGVHVELTGDQVGLDEWLSKETAQKLRAFSGGANKATGSSHPTDAQRWRAFVIAAHMERSNMTAEDVAQWLREEEEWDPEQAEELAIEYEQGRDLLKAYDEHRNLA